MTTDDKARIAELIQRWAAGTAADYADMPGRRLRLTIGLRKEHGRWVVSPEHHSFPTP